MPIYFEGKSECRRCGKTFDWVHYEMVKSSVRSGRFQVERIPSVPCARTVRQIAGNQTEYTVSCPHCGCVNCYVHNSNHDKQKREDD